MSKNCDRREFLEQLLPCSVLLLGVAGPFTPPARAQGEAAAEEGAEGGHYYAMGVQVDRCIGCAFCVQVPKRKADPYVLKICPWDAIEMVRPDLLPQAITQIGGPAEYVEKNQERLLEVAERVAAARHAAVAAKSTGR